MLNLSPIRVGLGHLVIQNWVPRFDPRNPPTLFTPVWISLGFLPLELMDNAREVVEFIDKVVAVDYSGGTHGDPRFKVALQADTARTLSLEVTCISGAKVEVLVNYEAEEIRCSHCYAHSYTSSRCSRKTRDRGGRLVAPPNRQAVPDRDPFVGDSPYERTAEDSEHDSGLGRFTLVEPRRPHKEKTPRAKYS